MTARVVVLDDYTNATAPLGFWAHLGRRAVVDVVTDSIPEQDLGARLAGYDVVVAIRERTQFTAATLERLPDLRLLALTGRNIGQADVAAASRLGILVTETDGSGAAAPELTIALILAAARQIPAHDHAVRGGGWQVSLGTELEGKTLAIAGLGRVGQRVARVGAALGMEVIASSQTLTEERAAHASVESVAWDDLFRRADVLSLHLRLVDATRRIVGAREISLLKPTALVVNTARAGLVDMDALFDALQSRRVAAAALDVFDVEPLPADSRWRRLENVVLSPHLGYFTREAFEIFFGQAVEQIEQFLAGETPTRALNPQVLRHSRP